MATSQRTDGLDPALAAYAVALRLAGRKARTVAAYEYRAKRFVRWLRSEAGDRQPIQPKSLEAIQAGLTAYVAAVRESELVSISGDSYIVGASRFVRWLTDTHTSRGDEAFRDKDPATELGESR